MSAYLDSHALLVGALAFGVWTLVALLVGILVGAVIHHGNTHEADGWTGDDLTDDTREITIPREWLTRSTFEDYL